MSNDRVSPVQLSVRELRQWLANLGEKHQDHFHKGQLSRARSQERLPQQDLRQSKGDPIKELESITAVKETQQSDRLTDWSESWDNRGVRQRKVVTYSNEYPAWYFRTIDQEGNCISSNGKFHAAITLPSYRIGRSFVEI